LAETPQPEFFAALAQCAGAASLTPIMKALFPRPN
jgi:hypothetical protein